MKYMAYLILSEKDIKQLKSWQVGNKYHLQLEVELKTLNKREDYETMMPGKKEPDEIVSGEFEIEKVVECDGKKVSFKKMYANAMQGKVS